MPYTGPPALTLERLLATWSPDWPAVAFCAVAAAGYLWAVRRAARNGTTWPRHRTLLFLLLGLGSVLVATCSFVGTYAHALEWVFVVHACLLLLACPPLLGLGAPVALAAAALSPAGRARGRRVARSLPVRLLRLPGVSAVLVIVVPAALLFSPWQEHALQSSAWFHVTQLVLLLAGLLLALPVTDEALRLSSIGYVAMLGIGFAEFLLDAIPGIVLRLETHILAPAYWLSLHRPWGPTPLHDQQAGGAWLWFFAEAGDIPFFAALLVSWVRSDAREAAEIDRVLDERGPVSTGTATTVVSARAEAEPAAPALYRPWWETDASVFGEDRARRHGWRIPGDGS